MALCHKWYFWRDIIRKIGYTIFDTLFEAYKLYKLLLNRKEKIIN